jgi:translation initiation factor IF-2
MIGVSGKTGEGIPELLDTIVLAASLENITGNHTLPAEGLIIESNLDVRKGIAATCIIKNGTVTTGMFVASRGCIAPVRVMENWLGTAITSATFSSPIRIIGWNALPHVGMPFRTFKTKKEAEEYSKIVDSSQKTADNKKTNVDAKIFPVIVKADTSGSLEAVMTQIMKCAGDRITPKIVHSGIGTISENDIRSANTETKATLIGFNVKVDSQAKTLADRDGIEIATFDIIYKLSEWLETKLIESTPRIEVEEVTGTAKVLKMFSKVKDKQIIGCRMESGTIMLHEQVKIIRRDAEIGVGKVRELQSQKQKISQVEEGKEFGTMIEAKIEIAPGDKLQAVTLVSK